MNSILRIPLDEAKKIHPSRDRWDRYSLDLLEEEERRELARHLEDCPRCQWQLEAIERERKEFAAQADIAQFIETISASPPSRWSEWWSSFGSSPFLLTATVAAILLISVVSLKDAFFSSSPRSARPMVSGIIRKGNALHSPKLDVYLERHSQVSRAYSGNQFQKDDILAFHYKAGSYRYLFMIYIDVKGEITPLYPAHPSEKSIFIAAKGQLRDSVKLDDAKGTEKIVSFFSQEPLSFDKVKELLRHFSKGLSGHRTLLEEKIHIIPFLIIKKA